MRIIVAAILISQTSISFSFENLQNGIGITEEVDSAIRNTSIPYAVARQGQRTADDNELVEAFIEVGDAVFSLSSKPDLIKTNTSNRELLAHWSLTRWPHTYIPQALIANYQFTSVGETDAQVAERLATPKSNFDGASNLLSNVGCLPATPLRYGTVFNANENDLVIILGGHLIVFSPTYQRTVFSEFFYQHDVDDLSADPDPSAWQTPQAHYGAWHYFKHGAITVHAVRSYAKLYDGDFDGDGHPDVLVWRKTYRANPITEEPGYSLVETSLEHFEQNLTAQAASEDGVTGEYLPQPTESVQIQTWLTEKNLTWQKGYPSQSECAGQENQLIPEMHDPLLNDADVLK